jgi:N-acetylglutamate synthase-like GNAT family acetyltransferase
VLVHRVAPAALVPLRHAVLRPDEPLSSLRLHGEDDPRSAHFAVLDEGRRVVACASVIPEGGPDAWRIRSVATDPQHRGRGFGRAVVRACIAHAQREGATRVWLQTTPQVAPWYEAQGFAREGEPYTMERGVRQAMVLKG